MNEEVPVVSLEDDDHPAPVEPPPPASVAAPPAEPVPAGDPEDIDPNDADLLKDEKRVRGLIAELSRKRTEVRDLKPQAERAAQLEAEVAQNRPYVEFLKANPALLQPKPAPVETPPDPAADPDAVAAAQLYDFYTPEGKPDAVKGARHLQMVRQEAQRITQQAVQPWQQASAQEKSNQNFHAVLQMKDPEGHSPSPEAVTAVWKQVLSEPNGLAITSDQRSAAFLAMAALGIDRMTKKPGVKPPPPALETEPSGGTPRTRPSLSGLEERVAADRGRTPAQWAKLTEGHQAGRASVLED